MKRLETSSLTDQDISAALLTHTYTADADRAVFVRLFASDLEGDGDYVAWVTVQRAGAGSVYVVGPKTTIAAAAAETAIGFTTIVVPIKDTDVMKVYVLGQAGDDTTPDIVTEIWEDDAMLAGTEVTADVVKISGDAAAADNAESFFDGTGYAGTNNVMPTTTTVTDGVTLTGAAVDDILDEVIEGTTTLRQMLRGIAAGLMGKATGGGTVTVAYRNLGDTKNRLEFTVDADGNRTAVNHDLTEV